MATQQTLEFRTWGGKRKGAGRKPSRPAPRHRRVRKRPRLTGREPVHVVVRVVPDVGRLRRRKAYQAIRRALLTVLAAGRMRVVHLSIQRTHVHLIVEAGDERALARGMQGFQISAARHLNAAVSVAAVRTAGRRGSGSSRTRVSGSLPAASSPSHRPRARMTPRRGQVFTDRYHAEILDTPRRARHCLSYVLNNWRRHREDQAGPRQRRAAVDPYSSGICFDGWRDHPTPFAFPPGYQPLVVQPATTWLLTVGWRRHGPFDLRATPGPTPLGRRSADGASSRSQALPGARPRQRYRAAQIRFRTQPEHGSCAG